MAVPELTLEQARRIAVRAQKLDQDRPDDLHDTVRRLTFLQLEPTAAVAPSADLVAWSRLGSSYDAADLRTALEEQTLLELHNLVRPPEDIALHRAEMAAWPGVEPLRPWQRETARWLEANQGCHRDVLDRLRSDGPLPSSELPDTCVVPWRSSGWNDHRNVQRVLTFLVARGEVAAAGREGRERLWDLAERVYPDDPVVPLDEARRRRDERRLAALGIARANGAEVPVDANVVGETGEEVTVAGVRGRWRVDPGQLARVDEPLAGRAALLSPFDRLVSDRKRTTELFGFEYHLEMYKPPAQRRWGYYALPVLHLDRFVGKLDARADRDAGVLRVHALHQDVPFDAATTGAVHAEVEDLARWLDLVPEGPE